MQKWIYWVFATIGLVIVGVALLLKNKVVATGSGGLTDGSLSNKSLTNTLNNLTQAVKTVVNVKAADKLGLTYEGQAIYSKYKGNEVPVDAIGYLADGTLLNAKNTIYADGEYKKKPTATTNPTTPPVVTYSSAGVNLSLKVGELNVDGTYQMVYQQKQGSNLYDYQYGIGYLENGSIVYSELINAGQQDEYSIYHT